MALTDKEIRYCELRVELLNRTEAAAQAKFGKTRANARVIACRLEKKPEIQAYIAELQDEWRERMGVSTERVLKELTAVAFSDIRDYVVWNDQIAYLKDSGEIGNRQAPAIAEVRNDHTGGGDDGMAKGVVKIRLHDKMQALDKLGRHLGMFKDDSTSVVVEVRLADEIKKARERANKR